MPQTLSPLPSWQVIREPEPSSDEDLILNQPAPYLPRKRKSKDQTTAQTASKRPKTTKNPSTSSNRTTNAIAGPSKPSQQTPSSRPPNGKGPRPSQPSSGSSGKLKTSRHSLTQPLARPIEPTSSAHTKLVRRTKKEKARQRSSSSDDEVLDPVPKQNQQPVRPGTAFPSASAPVQNNKFGRKDLRSRFQSKASPSKSAPLKRKVTANTDIIVVDDSSDEPGNGHPKPAINSDVVIVVSDSEADLEEAEPKSAGRKAQKRNGIQNDVVEIISDDEPPLAPKCNATGKNEDTGKGLPTPRAPNEISDLPPLPDPDANEMDLGADGQLDFGELQPDLPQGREHEMPLDSVAIRTEAVPHEVPRGDLADQRSQPTHLRSASAAATTVVLDGRFDGVSISDVSSARTGDSKEPQVSHGDLSNEDPLSLKARNPIPEVSQMTESSAEENGLPKNDRPPSLPPSLSFTAENSHIASPDYTPPGLFFRPNALLGVYADNVPEISHDNSIANGSPAPAARTPFPPSTPPVLETRRPQRTPTPLHRLSFPVGPRINPGVSDQSSPYKGIRDKALAASPATLQQSLGLPTKVQTALPRLDLSSLSEPVKPLPLPKKRRLPPLSTADSAPLTRAEPERSTPSVRDLSTPSSPPPPPSQTKKPKSWISQRSVVDAIIITGQHNTQSTAALLQPLPGRDRVPGGAAHQASPALPPPLPKVKAEEPLPSGPSTALIDHIIDLTLSDTEADADPPHVSASTIEAPVPVQPPRPSMNPLPRNPQQSNEDIRQKHAKRIRKLIEKYGTPFQCFARPRVKHSPWSP
ncbi:hypothetical protein C8F04DRAFT_723472 [Mycena alexandri]|uniref:Uncharacterized protein n=1 Tax=Mycena alexandri TaxID=1745969 RepID=A0AAD6X906_9AGAR|nr:hypothetical protein C8F04DRAFT_723472 [Mycena alexandri]